jgi:branched-chain amino acid transport system substrate-binding protein
VPAGLRCLLAWLLLVPLAGGAGVPRVTLGLVVPPSEPDAASLVRGVQLAVADANETGEAPVGLEVRGEGGQWGTAGNDAVVLVSERHVDAIISPTDGATNHLILQVSGRTQVPVASLCSDSSVTEAGVPWAVRVVPRTDQEAETLFAAARRTDRSPLHWWAVVPTGRAGRAVHRDLEKAARSTATPLDKFVEGGSPKADLAPWAHSIAAAAPDGVLLWLAPSQAGSVASALRSAGYGGRLAGPSTLDAPAFVSTAGAAAAGVWATGYRADAVSRATAEHFEAQFGRRHQAKPDFIAAVAYDAARVLIETLRRADSRGGFAQFPLVLPIAGATGMLHFDRSGNRTDALQALCCREGRFIPLFPKDP